MPKAALLMLVFAPLAARAASPDSPLDRILAYAGSWTVEIVHLDTPFSKAGHEVTHLRNDCWKSGAFVACNQVIDGVSKALIVFTYDAKTNRYTTYPIPADGGDPSSGVLLIDGNTWTYPWSIVDAAGTKTHYRVVNTFSSPTHIDYRQEYSTDQVHWTLMGRGGENKAP